jgi:uncharacterized repeat protein (TIGR04138 family)
MGLPVRHNPAALLDRVVETVGVYPREAFEFVQAGLAFTTAKLGRDQDEGPRHVSGQELCEGLRRFALEQWGLLASTVLHRWNVRKTADFGVMVYAMIEASLLGRSDDDRIEDFTDVFDFSRHFHADYRIACETPS